MTKPISCHTTAISLVIPQLACPAVAVDRGIHGFGSSPLAKCGTFGSSTRPRESTLLNLELLCLSKISRSQLFSEYFPKD